MAYEKYGFNSNKTKYDLADIDKLKQDVSNIETNILKRVYPIGSIYFTTSKTNPGDKSMLGFGSWNEVSTEQRFIVITPTTRNWGVKQMAGVNSFKLAANQLPDHAHRIETTFSYPSAKQPWGNIRVIPKGTGGSAGTTPYHLGYSIASRRGYGSTVTALNNAGNVNVTRQDPSQDVLNNSFALETTAGKEKQSQRPDVLTIDISDKVKIEGFTGAGIYTEELYNSTNPQPNGTYSWSDLAQTNIDNRPAFITLYCWERVG